MLSNQQSMELTRVIINCIDNVMVSMLALSVVDHWITGQTKDNKIGICCFSTKHTALRSKNKGWLAHNRDNASEWTDMSTLVLLF